jgi:hypothetical protein
MRKSKQNTKGRVLPVGTMVPGTVHNWLEHSDENVGGQIFRGQIMKGRICHVRGIVR